MSDPKIETYKMKNGVDILKVYCKPTVKFLDGKNYFYADARAIDLVKKYVWRLSKDENRVYVQAKDGWHDTCVFSQEWYKLCLGHPVEYVDHINSVGFDNINQNLNIVTNQQNQFNRLTKGYYYKNKSFKSKITLNGQSCYPFPVVHGEDEACMQRNNIEQCWLKDGLGNDYYMFDFKKYRRGSEDILDGERTGIISEDEAVYQHIMRYAENAWFYLRFGLQDYFKDNNIAVPKYALDENGFMVHPITNQKLCPF